MYHIKKCRLLLLCLWFGLVPVARASATDATAEEATMFPYREHRLANGMRVISLEDHSCPIAAVQVWYHVGSKDESPDRQGFAHMFEHMMFRGTDRLGPTDHFDLIRSVGGTNNGYTSFDQTVYLQTLPANQLELALWLEAERMSFLTIDQESFDTERKVVEEERRMGLNQPYGDAEEKGLAILFKQHPYRWSPIGNIAHLRASSVPELRAWWQRYYSPNNATLIVVGDVAYERVCTLAQRYFGWIEDVPLQREAFRRDPDPCEPVDATLELENAPAPVAALGWRTVGAGHEDALGLELIAKIAGGGVSSRLYGRLVLQESLAVTAMADVMVLEQDGMFFAIAPLNPLSNDLDRVVAVMKEELELIRTGGVTQHELEKARNQILRDRVMLTLRIDGKARMLGDAAVVGGNLASVNEEMDRLRAITVQDLTRIAAQYLDPNRSYTIRVPRTGILGLGKGLARLFFGSKRPEESAPITAEPEREAPPPGRPGVTRPELYPVKPPMAEGFATIAEPKVHRHQTRNGVRVLIVTNTEMPVVFARLLLPFGAWCEHKPGVANLTLTMLRRGTENYTEEELADECETHAISLSAEAAMDSSQVSASCLKEHFPRMMKLLGEVVLRPTFPSKPLETVRAQTLTYLTMLHGTPSYLADRELNRRLYGSHPYARNVTGEPTDVGTIDVNDLESTWKVFAQPDKAFIIVVGDVTPDEVVAQTEKVFGDWKAQAPKLSIDLAVPENPETNHIYVVDRPGAAQSEIRIAQLGVTHTCPQIAESDLVEAYFGGDFGSRLNHALRVQKGLTYGAHGYFDVKRFLGSFIVSTFTKTDRTAEAVHLALAEIARLREESPTPEELRRQQRYFLGSVPARYETPQQVAGMLAHIVLNDLPDDHFRWRYARIGELDAEGCMQFVRQTVYPDRMVIVVVGDSARVAEPLKSIAPVTVVKPEAPM